MPTGAAPGAVLAKGAVNMGQSSEDSDLPVVHVEGEIDMAAAPELQRRLDELIDDGKSTIVVDLLDVTFLDSAALGVLVRSLQRCQDAGGTLHLVVDDRRITRVLEITGLSDVFPIHDRWSSPEGEREEQAPQ